jgi:hypothetical protein
MWLFMPAVGRCKVDVEARLAQLACMRLQQQPMGAAVEALARQHPCSRLALLAAAPMAAIKAIFFS